MKFGGCLQSSENPTKAMPYEGKEDSVNTKTLLLIGKVKVPLVASVERSIWRSNKTSEKPSSIVLLAWVPNTGFKNIF